MVGITTATIIILLSSGGGVEHYLTDLKGPLKDHVPEKERREAVLDASKQLGKDLKKLEKAVNAHFADFVRTHSEYHSTGKDFDAATAALLEDQQQTMKLILDARDEMHGQMSREEWEAVFKSKE